MEMMFIRYVMMRAYLPTALRRNRPAVRLVARLGALVALIAAASMLLHDPRVVMFDLKASIWEHQIRQGEGRLRAELGAGGEAVVLRGEEAARGAEDVRLRAMNVLLSDLIPYNRSLRDTRTPACKSVLYDAELPSAGLIIIFHNEPFSVVVRTLWSVVNNARRDQPWYRTARVVSEKTGRTMKLGYPGQDPHSLLVYLKEIILVDDGSTLPELKGKLSHYIRTRLPPDLIRIIRMPERVGVIGARTAGARASHADALVFVDAHCEAQRDWLRPLLQRVRDQPRVVAMPVIDLLNATNFMYSILDRTIFSLPGFLFEGYLYYVDIPPREIRRRGSDIAPTRAPMMAGGLFAMDRRYFWQLGGYDEKMVGWGGENLEMAFRVWQCGGSLEVLPCSRVGHVGFEFHPYIPNNSDWFSINTARMAEVWMDEYAELIYLYRPHLRNHRRIGSVSDRAALRRRLRCKTFKWYLHHVYREKFVPVRDSIAHGRFRNPVTDLCLEAPAEESSLVMVARCRREPSLAWGQLLYLSVAGRLRDELHCVQLESELQHEYTTQASTPGRPLILVHCEANFAQTWRHLPSKQLQHESGWCLDAGFKAGQPVHVRPCRPAAPSQLWEIQFVEERDLLIVSEKNLTQSLRNLLKIRSHRHKFA